MKKKAELKQAKEMNEWKKKEKRENEQKKKKNEQKI